MGSSKGQWQPAPMHSWVTAWLVRMPHSLRASPANLGTNQFCRAGEALGDVRPCIRCHGLQEQQSFSASKHPILLMQHNKVMAWQWWSLLHGPPTRLADGPHPKPPPSRGHWLAAFLHASQLPQPKWRRNFRILGMHRRVKRVDFTSKSGTIIDWLIIRRKTPNQMSKMYLCRQRQLDQIN